MKTECTTLKRGKQAELALAQIYAEQLPEEQVLEDRRMQPDKVLALVKTPAAVDWDHGIDFWLIHKNIGWISADITIDDDPERLHKKRGKAREEEIYILRFELGTLIRAARGCQRDLEQVIAVLTDVFSEELAQRQHSPTPIHYN
ncbi:MAG: hypothetical protein DWQ07_17485 [Chloroflexi bacterium]|nr:MAG: hypothetical protein DWQ07_17485 [Chloroflexota bacterium]